MKINQHIIGSVQLKSTLTIEELGHLISKKILGGVPLEGLEKNIYEEVPAIFNELLGFTLVLQGYSGHNHETGFWFDLIPNFSSNEARQENINLSWYLIELFKNSFKDCSDVKIIESQA